MAASVLSGQDRAELARAVLAHAELRTGARSVRVGARPASGSEQRAEASGHALGSAVVGARSTGAAAPSGAAHGSASASRTVPRPAPSEEGARAAQRTGRRVTAPEGSAVAQASSTVLFETAVPSSAEGNRVLVAHEPSVGPSDPSGGPPVRALDEAAGRAHHGPSGHRPTGVLTAERPPLPVPDRLAPLLPDGLRRGATTAVVGSTSLVLSMLAHACAGGAWAAVVGQPTVGLLAAAQAGVALDRLAVVPRPGADAATVVAALVDGIDVVLVGPEAALTDTDRRRLSARARDRGAVLLSSVPWPGASTVLTVEAGRWTGVGAGDGRLRTHELRVTRTGRGGSAVPLSVDLALPLSATQPTAPAVSPATVVADVSADAPGLRLVG